MTENRWLMFLQRIVLNNRSFNTIGIFHPFHGQNPFGKLESTAKKRVGDFNVTNPKNGLLEYASINQNDLSSSLWSMQKQSLLETCRWNRNNHKLQQ